MNFHHYKPMWTQKNYHHKGSNREKALDFHAYRIGVGTSGKVGRKVENENARICAEIDCEWIDAIQPYYKVWPSIYDALKKINLNVPMNQLSLPDLLVSLRFGIGYEPVISPYRIHSVLVCIITAAKGKSALLVMSELGHESGVDGKTRLWQWGTPLDLDKSIASVWDTHLMDDVLPRYREPCMISLCRTVLSMSVGVALLSEDPAIFDRDVLAKDQGKFDDTKEDRYIEKARKRGINGWSIGKHFETCPHWRRPHLALRWTGKGRKLPRIVPIKSCIVHRKKITDVPTGYTLPSGQDVEPISTG